MRHPERISDPDHRANHELLELMTRPWSYQLFRTLEQRGPTRFGALRREIRGISSRLLTKRLREFETKGLVFRKSEATVLPAVTYGLTKRADDLRTVFELLLTLTRKWRKEDTKRARRHTSRGATEGENSRESRKRNSRDSRPGIRRST